MTIPIPNDHSSIRVPWLPTDGPASDKHIFFLSFGSFLSAVVGIALWSNLTHGRQITADKWFRWHFLGGKSYNALISALSIFATLLSPAAIASVPTEASTHGWISLKWLTGAMWTGVGMIILLPRFYRLSGMRQYDSPNDYVSDRFNNRVLSVTTTTISMTSMLMYIMLQINALADLVPAFSRTATNEQVLDRDVTTWVLSAVVLTIQLVGGFDAIVMSDVFQGAVMLGAFIVLPVSFGYFYGDLAGAGDSAGYDCENFYVLNCSDPAFTSFGSPCATADNAVIYRTGCFAYSKSFVQLHPAGISDSLFYGPLTQVAASGCNESAAVCTPTVIEQMEWFQTVAPAAWKEMQTTFPLPGPYAESRVSADPQDTSPLPSYIGIDGDETMSRTAYKMMSFNFMLFSVALFPHLVMKAMAVRSEKDLRVTEFSLTFGTLVSIFPMILVGLTVSAVLGGIYPDAYTKTFVVAVDDMANRGGWSEYMAAFIAVGATAAVLSTLDSALVSVTNIFASDILRNWALHGAKDALVIRVGKVFAAGVMVVCTSIVLYEPTLHDNDDMYASLVQWQAAFWQILPVSMLSMYWDLNGWACLVGQMCGIACTIGLWWNQTSCQHWNTAYAWQKNSYSYSQPLSQSNYPETCDISTYLLDLHVWSAVVNIMVTATLSVVFWNLGLSHTSKLLRMPHVEKKFGDEGGELTLGIIRCTMQKPGTREPIHDPVGIVCILLTLVLTTVSLPWFGDAYNNCDQFSYERWQACEIAGVDCKAMCDIADLSLPPTFPSSALLVDAAACLSNTSMPCNCPIQGGFYLYGGTAIPTKPLANVSFDETVSSLNAGGGVVFEGQGNGKICNGYDLIHGLIPRWAVYVLSAWLLAMLCMGIAWLQWRCSDSQLVSERHQMPKTVENSEFVTRHLTDASERVTDTSL